MMRALIADDEPVARQVLREMLEEVPGVSVGGEAATGNEAVEAIARLEPDILFLDLHMPGLDGLSVVRSLRGQALPLVIYVTAFEEHALDAFETGAVDYLLKPVRQERLRAAVEKARAQLAGLGSRPAAEAPPGHPPRKIAGRLGEDLHLLDLGDVIGFVAQGEVVTIIAASGRFRAGRPLRELERRLPSPPFRRISRSAIVSTDHIRRISPLSSKRWLLSMSNGMEAVVSKRMAGVIREAAAW
jgi:two-component system LytT family response regulator